MASSAEKVARLTAKALRPGGGFDLEALERIGCAMFENGFLPEDIVQAVSECFPEDEKPCRKERSLIEESFPLLAAGAAAMTMLLPFARIGRWLAGLASAARVAVFNILHGFRIPWLSRLLGNPSNQTAFDVAQANLTKEYLAAMATATDIIVKAQASARISPTVKAFLAIAGIGVISFETHDAITGDFDGEQTDDGA